MVPAGEGVGYANTLLELSFRSEPGAFGSDPALPQATPGSGFGDSMIP